MKKKFLSLLTLTFFSGLALAADYGNTLNSIPSLTLHNMIVLGDKNNEYSNS